MITFLGLDIWTLAAIVLFLYILWKELPGRANSVLDRVRTSFSSAKKPGTYVILYSLLFFILGELYVAWLLGYTPSADWFWVPFWVALILLFYYYA